MARHARPSCTASPIMFTLAHSALFIKQELLADRANRKPAGDGFVYEGNDCRGFPGRPDGYSDWTCPPKRTAAGSCGPFLLAAIALKLPATSTARSWPARDAARSDADGRALETPVGDQPKAPGGGCRKCSKCRRGVTNEGRGPSCTFCTSCTSRRVGRRAVHRSARHGGPRRHVVLKEADFPVSEAGKVIHVDTGITANSRLAWPPKTIIPKGRPRNGGGKISSMETDWATIEIDGVRIADGYHDQGIDVVAFLTASEAGRLWTLSTIEVEVAVRLGWSGMASP